MVIPPANPVPAPVETRAPDPAPNQFHEWQPIQQVGPSILPPGAPLPEPIFEEVPPVAEVAPVEEAPAEAAPVAKPTVPAEPAPTATSSASASAPASAEPIAIERADSPRGFEVPLLAGLSVVILGCIAGLVKIFGFPRRHAA